MMNSDSPADRDRAKKKLARWQVDPHLAGIRDQSALQNFSKDERGECLALWREVTAVLNRGQTNK